MLAPCGGFNLAVLFDQEVVNFLIFDVHDTALDVPHALLEDILDLAVEQRHVVVDEAERGFQDDEALQKSGA
jgi:predicted GTPase